MDMIKVLYLDDEENNLIAFKALFRREFDVFTTTSPQEAVAYLNANEVPIILSDQKMPELSGVEFFELTLNDFPNAVRILVTGYADIEAVIDAINRGQVYRYVAKPWNENDLRVCLLNAAERYEMNIHSSDSDSKSNKWKLAKSRIQDAIHKVKAVVSSWKGMNTAVPAETLNEVVNELNALEESVNEVFEEAR
jgi:response regulator RpfG family c-di-GMP phosphodiesterase